MGQVTALSRAVTTVTWLSHGSHEPDMDESRLEQASPGTSASEASKPASHWVSMVPLLARNQMWGPEQRRRALEQAVPIGQAQAVPIYPPGAQGRSIMCNNVKNWPLLPILTCYCLFLPIIDLP